MTKSQNAPQLGRIDITKRPHVGLYPGTFDPVTLGHLDIIKRAVKLVDRLVIGVVALNDSKSQMFSVQERVEMLRHEAEPLGAGRTAIEVLPFDTLTVNFAVQVGANTIIRGLRAVTDFEYEFQMVGTNQKLNPDVETVFLMADPRHQHIASRLVKEIARLGGDVTPFLTKDVADLLMKRCKEIARK
jgi:pantetheine-phosphate adenylyltransferase